MDKVYYCSSCDDYTEKSTCSDGHDSIDTELYDAVVVLINILYSMAKNIRDMNRVQ